MKTDSWTRLDSAIIVTVWIMMLVIVGLSVKFKERGTIHVAGQSADWKCYPKPYKHAQPACFNMADARPAIAPDATASLKLSGVSLALR